MYDGTSEILAISIIVGIFMLGGVLSGIGLFVLWIWDKINGKNTSGSSESKTEQTRKR